jgi:hypothetical protein
MMTTYGAPADDLGVLAAVLAQLGAGVMPTPADITKAQAAFASLAKSLATLPPAQQPVQPQVPPGTWFSAPVTAAATLGGLLVGGVTGWFARKAAER